MNPCKPITQIWQLSSDHSCSLYIPPADCHPRWNILKQISDIVLAASFSVCILSKKDSFILFIYLFFKKDSFKSVISITLSPKN